MRRRTTSFWLLAAVAVLAAAPPALAAEAPAAKPPPAAKAAPAPPAVPAAPAPPPYEPQLLRMAEMMGALAYLRDLCGMGDSAEFRSKTAALIEAQGADAERRDQLAGAYNKGFRDYAANYRVCGPAADAVIRRYLAETARLAADLASRYGG